MNITYTSEHSITIPDDIANLLQSLIKTTGRVPAMRYLRAVYGLGLKDSKDIVEKYFDHEVKVFKIGQDGQQIANTAISILDEMELNIQLPDETDITQYMARWNNAKLGV